MKTPKTVTRAKNPIPPIVHPTIRGILALEVVAFYVALVMRIGTVT